MRPSGSSSEYATRRSLTRGDSVPAAAGAEPSAGREALRRGKLGTRCRARCCLVLPPQGMEREDNFTYRIVIERDPDRNAAGTETGAGGYLQVSAALWGISGMSCGEPRKLR